MDRWQYLLPTFNYYANKYKDPEMRNYFTIPFSDESFGIKTWFEYLKDQGFIIKEIFILGKFIAYKK